MKKTWLFLLLVLLTLGGRALFADQAQADPTGARAVPDHVILTWTADPATTQTVTWRAASSVQDGVVQYQRGSSLDAARRTARARRDDFVTSLGPVAIFSAALTGLEPGETYAYRVGDGANWSRASTFSTAPKAPVPFSFLVFGDSQSGVADNPEYGPWRDTVHNAFRSNRTAKFMVNMGDLVEVGLSAAHWNNWFTAAAGVIDAIPDMAIQGNHETYADNITGSVKPVAWQAQFPLPQNGPDGLKNQVYSWDYGSVHFTVLDSQEDEEAPTYGDILGAQVQWLDRDLAQTRQPWKLVFFHKTPYYLKASRANEAVKAAFCPVLDRYHADVVFNGHDHGVARTYALNGDEFVTRPSQGTVYVVTGRSGNKAYPDLSKKVWNSFFYDPQDQPNYMVVRVAGNVLTITTVKQDGTIVDTFSIDKAKDTDTDMAVAPVPDRSWVKYSSPTLVMFGNVVSPTMVAQSPKQKDGSWWVDLNAVAGYMGGTVSADGTAVRLGGKDSTIPANMIFMDKALMVSVEALKSVGFSASFHPATNILELVR